MNTSGTTEVGLYRAFRNDLMVFPTQNLKVSGTPGASAATLDASVTGTRTFY